jgi:hypothetical protein
MQRPIEALVVKRDGNMFFAYFDDFTNLMESPAGFGYSITLAIEDLTANSGRSVALSEFAA